MFVVIGYWFVVDQQLSIYHTFKMEKILCVLITMCTTNMCILEKCLQWKIKELHIWLNFSDVQVHGNVLRLANSVDALLKYVVKKGNMMKIVPCGKVNCFTVNVC